MKGCFHGTGVAGPPEACQGGHRARDSGAASSDLGAGTWLPARPRLLRRPSPRWADVTQPKAAGLERKPREPPRRVQNSSQSPVRLPVVGSRPGLAVHRCPRSFVPQGSVCPDNAAIGVASAQGRASSHGDRPGARGSAKIQCVAHTAARAGWDPGACCLGGWGKGAVLSTVGKLRHTGTKFCL